jgi:hypothetical protein
MEVSESMDVSEVTGGAGRNEEYSYPSDTLTVHQAHFSNPTTGEHIRIDEVEGKDQAFLVRRSYGDRHLGTIAEVPKPRVSLDTGSRIGTPVPGADRPGYTVSKSQRRSPSLSERRRAEHRERVAQAHRTMPDPQSALSDMVARSLGPDGLRMVEEYLNDRLGTTETIDGDDGRPPV